MSALVGLLSSSSISMQGVTASGLGTGSGLSSTRTAYSLPAVHPSIRPVSTAVHDCCRAAQLQTSLTFCRLHCHFACKAFYAARQ